MHVSESTSGPVTPPRRKVNILIWDIENTPIKGYTWGMHQQNVLKIIEPSHVLCFAYRWYGSDEPVQLVTQRDFPRSFKRNRKDDSRVAKAAWDLLDKADIVVAHNGVSFDTKKMKAAFVKNGLPNPSPFKQVDTLAVSRRHFKFDSHKLNNICQLLGIGKKTQHTGFDLWDECMEGVPAAWDLMEEYNIQDVVLLEELYEKFLLNGWIDNHPNMAMLSGNYLACPSCGVEGRLERRGFYYALNSTYQRYLCKNCGKWPKKRKSGKGPLWS